jgi:pyruvyltransferase
MSEDACLNCKPKKVLAVRGPLTRKFLLTNGIDCPEVYGDPALLLPYYYNPIVAKKYKIGIIPHYIDKKNVYVSDFISKYILDVKLIDIVNYVNWYDFINEIYECEFIISSSLHGLIVSDAYNIPNYWIEFSKNIPVNRFKYKDYYMYVKKTITDPCVIDREIDISTILMLKKLWQPPNISIDSLIKSCPFEIHLNY